MLNTRSCMREGTNEQTYTMTKHITTLLLRSWVKIKKFRIKWFCIIQKIRFSEKLYYKNFVEFVESGVEKTSGTYPTPKVVKVVNVCLWSHSLFSIVRSEAPSDYTFWSEGRLVAFCFWLETPSNANEPRIRWGWLPRTTFDRLGRFWWSFHGVVGS